jgi:hypothetical protein
MNLPRALRGFGSRLIFGIIGAFFAMIAVMAIHGGQIRVGRTTPDYVSVRDEPVQFWLLVSAATLMSVVGFYCAMERGKR